MPLDLNDWVGLSGVAILLLAYLLNLTNKLNQKSLTYILMNVVGAGLACLASYLINYFPFVILEGVWIFVSLIALIKYIQQRNSQSKA